MIYLESSYSNFPRFIYENFSWNSFGFSFRSFFTESYSKTNPEILEFFFCNSWGASSETFSRFLIWFHQEVITKFSIEFIREFLLKFPSKFVLELPYKFFREFFWNFVQRFAWKYLQMKIPVEIPRRDNWKKWSNLWSNPRMNWSKIEIIIYYIITLKQLQVPRTPEKKSKESFLLKSPEKWIF